MELNKDKLHQYHDVIHGCQPLPTELLWYTLDQFTRPPDTEAAKGRVQMAALPASTVVALICELLMYRERDGTI